MKKKTENIRLPDTVLDEYEQAIEASLQDGEYSSTEDLEAVKKLFEETSKYHAGLQRTKRITLRVNQIDLLKVKARARKSRIPYQRLISALIRQYAEGKIRLSF